MNKYKKSGYFNFEIFKQSKQKSEKTDSKTSNVQKNKIEDFNIPTDEYKKTMMKIRKIKYEIKD